MPNLFESGSEIVQQKHVTSTGHADTQGESQEMPRGKPPWACIKMFCSRNVQKPRLRITIGRNVVNQRHSGGAGDVVRGPRTDDGEGHQGPRELRSHCGADYRVA